MNLNNPDYGLIIAAFIPENYNRGSQVDRTNAV
jgi:hypothetical protein